MPQEEIDDTSDDEVVSLRKPKRSVADDKNTTIKLTGVIIDAVTNLPVAGVRVQALGDNRYTAMTNADGKFVVNISSLYITAPSYMAQQVAIKSNDPSQKVSIKLISNKFRTMYSDDTEYTASATYKVNGGGIVIDEEIHANLGGHMRAITRSGVLDGGSVMFIRGLNSINSNSQPLIIIDGVETDMQLNRAVLHRGMESLIDLGTQPFFHHSVVKNH